MSPFDPPMPPDSSAQELPDEVWITISEAAQLSGRSPTQFYVWRSKGRSPVRIEEIEGRVRVNADDLRQWTAANPMREKAPSTAKTARLPQPRLPQHSLKPNPPAPRVESPRMDTPRSDSSRAETPRAVARGASATQFSFVCETGAELKQWAEFLDELARRGVQLKFRVDGGRITLT